MSRTISHKNDWVVYYENHKKLWYDPTIPHGVKAVIHIVELHRSDSQGWYLSVRKMANLLGCAARTAQRWIKEAVRLGFIEASTSTSRKRRKLRLSVSLRSPVGHENSTHELVQWNPQSVRARTSVSVIAGDTVNSNRNIKTIVGVEEENNTEYPKLFEEGAGYQRAKGVRDRLSPPVRPSKT